MRYVLPGFILLQGWVVALCWAQPAVQQHVADLHSSNVLVRQQSAARLGRLGARSAVPDLIDALTDPECGVRRQAARALGSIKDGRAASGLVNALEDSDTNVRMYAAYALGELKDRKAAAALLKALQDPEWCVRDQAAWALREINDPRIAEPLVQALAKKNAAETQITWILKAFDPSKVTALVAELLKAPDAETRVKAVRVAEEIGGPAAVDLLLLALDDAHPDVRRIAVQRLLKPESHASRKALQELAARERDPLVLEAVEKALFQLSPRKHLIAWWNFDDGSTEVARDVTGRGNDGQILGCTPVEGKVDYGLRFQLGQYIEFGRPTALPIAGQPLTVTAWVKSTKTNGVVIARGGAFCGFSLYIKDGVAKFGIHRVTEEPAYIAAGTDRVVDRWVHLAGVVKPDCIELYVDGKLAAATETPGYIPGNCGQGMEIGFDVANSPAEITDHFEGIIDEVKVYDTALSEEDLEAMTKTEVLNEQSRSKDG